MVFQTDYNYHRALVWTAVMTTLSHLDSNFGSVFAIEAVNGMFIRIGDEIGRVLTVPRANYGCGSNSRIWWL